MNSTQAIGCNRTAVYTKTNIENELSKLERVADFCIF